MRSETAGRTMAAMALVFLLKASVLALFVTPLWDVPDETGHYAVIADLADGKGLPLPGRSVLPPDVLADWSKGKTLTTEEKLNWVAQHPPLYHLLAVPFLAAARAVTPDPRWRYRSPRLLSALCGAAALLLFFAVFREAGADDLLAFVSASAFGFVPMYSHLSSGINHDMLLAFLSGAAALCWVRLEKSGSPAEALKLGGALALMGATKLSALPVAAVLVLLSWRPLAAARRRLVWLASAAIAFSLSLLWAARHWLLLHNTRVHPVSSRPFDLTSFFSYLRSDPVVDHTFKNFVGLIGWTGTGGGEVRWFQISGIFLAPYVLLSLAAAIGAAIWFARRQSRPIGAITSAAAAAAVFLFCSLWLFAAGDGAEPVKRILYSLLAAVPLLALPAAFRERDPVEAIPAGSQLVFLVFSAAFLVNSWGAYEIYGQMRATNGRYFFAILPFLTLAFVVPAARLLPGGRRRDLLLLALLAALFANETAFFLVKVIPFYRG